MGGQRLRFSHSPSRSVIDPDVRGSLNSEVTAMCLRCCLLDISLVPTDFWT